MAKKKKSKKTKKLVVDIIAIIIFAVFGTISAKEFQLVQTAGNIPTEEIVTNIEIDENKLELFFFDVGQADSILIMNKGKTMLIDAGNDENGEQIVEDIKTLGINKLDYLVVTHMHADHMGGMDKVIRNFDVGTMYMPDTLQTTKQVEEMLDAMLDTGLTYESPEIGDTFMLGNANAEVVYIDNEETENLNNSSIVIELTFEEQKLLFTGDAEKEVEEKLNLGKINILKVGHHGSSTSSSDKFIKQIKPDIAVMQVGKDNSYNHPHSSVVKRLQKNGAIIYRTDELGTIWISCDGTESIVKKIGEESEI